MKEEQIKVFVKVDSESKLRLYQNKIWVYNHEPRLETESNIGRWKV